MQGNKSIKPDYNAVYDKSDLLRPHKLIVNFGERSTLLYDNEMYSEAYDMIFKEAKRVLRTAILTNSSEAVSRLPAEELSNIRNARGVSFIFHMPLEIEAVYKLMNISSGDEFGIKSVDEVIVAQSLNRAYILDSSQNAIFELNTVGIQNNLDYLLSNLDKQPTIPSIYLYRFDPELYDEKVVVATKSATRGLPVVSGTKELQASEEIPESIANLFNDEISSLSIIKNMDGTLIYTDREDQVVKLYPSGMLEYVSYKLASASNSTINVRSAIDISTEFVRKNFGFPENCYISDIIKSMHGDRYIIRYRYAYEGLPVIVDSSLSNDAIEVEIVGDEVRRYKRMIRELSDNLEYKQVMSFIDVLNILLDQKTEALSGERIKRINDMYLAYYELYGQTVTTYIPVWVAEVTVERLENGTVLNQRYIINAETGIILDK